MVKTNPCAHCKGKVDEKCPCADKTIYEIERIDHKKEKVEAIKHKAYQVRRTSRETWNKWKRDRR